MSEAAGSVVVFTTMAAMRGTKRLAFLAAVLSCLLLFGCAKREPGLTEQDRKDEATADGLAKMYGPNHELVATSLNAKALDYSGRNMHSQAERLLRRVVAIREAGGPAAGPALATSLLALGGELEKRGNVFEAESVYRRAIAIREKGGTPAELATSLQFLADALAAQKKYAEAEPVFRRRIEVCEGHCGSEDQAHALRDYGLFLERTGRKDEAKPWLARSDEIFRSMRP